MTAIAAYQLAHLRSCTKAAEASEKITTLPRWTHKQETTRYRREKIMLVRSMPPRGMF